MKFAKGMILGGLITTGMIMMYKNNITKIIINIIVINIKPIFFLSKSKFSNNL